MEIQFQLSKKDYIEFSKLYIKDNLKKRPWVFILITILAIFLLSGDTILWWRFLLALVLAPVITLFILYFLPFVISVLRINKAIAKDESLLESKNLITSEDGIKIESESKTDFWKWESMISAHSNEKFVYFILANKKVIPVPLHCFQSESESVDFLALIQKKFFFSKSAVITSATKVKRPSYLFGLLCLIPGWGAIAGIIFIINGINKYKDKWFVIIGFGGVLFTIVGWYVVFYTGALGFDGLMVQQSQRQLNSVMKAVEFYKIKNGVYPDSLEQINNDNSEIWIFDPLKSHGEVKKTDNYNYQKVGNHYYLFSSGIDGVPNTKDDLYPQVAKSDSSKFGLIHK